jgi:hypothetical protein
MLLDTLGEYERPHGGPLNIAARFWPSPTNLSPTPRCARSMSDVEKAAQAFKECEWLAE